MKLFAPAGEHGEEGGAVVGGAAHGRAKDQRAQDRRQPPHVRPGRRGAGQDRGDDVQRAPEEARLAPVSRGGRSARSRASATGKMWNTTGNLVR